MEFRSTKPLHSCGTAQLFGKLQPDLRSRFHLRSPFLVCIRPRSKPRKEITSRLVSTCRSLSIPSIPPGLRQESEAGDRRTGILVRLVSAANPLSRIRSVRARALAQVHSPFAGASLKPGDFPLSSNRSRAPARHSPSFTRAAVLSA